ncbi:MAG: hypothetical protein R3F56_17855 [Planctomycetota bacterium]
MLTFLHTRVPVLSLWVVAMAAARPAASQDEASALASLVGRADVVSLARAVRVGDGTPGQLQVVLRIEETLLGTAPAIVTLSEPEERGCGRALLAVATGQRFVACLRRQGENFALVAAGARALPLATATVVAHVRALATAAAGMPRLTVLIDALDSDDARVCTDAALALPLEPTLPAIGADQRAAVVAALRRALPARSRGLPSLVVACTHLGESAAIEVMLPSYLDGSSGPAERLLATAMLQIDQGALARALGARIDRLASPLERARALTLLDAMDGVVARAPLQALVRAAAERGTRVRACACLLRNGAPESDLAGVVEPAVLDSARQAAKPQRPRFRSIRPE